MNGLGVGIKVDDAIDLELVAPNARCSPPPANLVTVAEHGQSLYDRQRRGLRLAIDVGLLAWEGGLTQLWERRNRQCDWLLGFMRLECMLYLRVAETASEWSQRALGTCQTRSPRRCC